MELPALKRFTWADRCRDDEEFKQRRRLSNLHLSRILSHRRPDIAPLDCDISYHKYRDCYYGIGPDPYGVPDESELLSTAD